MSGVSIRVGSWGLTVRNRRTLQRTRRVRRSQAPRHGARPVFGAQFSAVSARRSHAPLL